jgi:hypothetical protein
MLTNLEGGTIPTKKLTIAQLKKFKGLSNLTDEEAGKIIDKLHMLSIITHTISTLTNK